MIGNFSSLGTETVRDGNEVHGLFSQEFKQSGAFEIADLGSYNSILLNLKRSAVQSSIEV